MVLLVDNFDSFTWNLVHYFQELGCEVRVVRNNAITLDYIRSNSPSHVVISPGPGRPEDTGNLTDILPHILDLPILGVCLGHQLLAQLTGAVIHRASRTMHGKTSVIQHDGKGVYSDIPQNIHVCRYHSLSIDRQSLSDEWIVTAESSDDNEVMGIRHQTLPRCGMQFHPEAILTEHGHEMLENFLRLYSQA